MTTSWPRCAGPSLLASERSHGVKLHLEPGTLELSASNPDQGEASEDLEVAYTGDPITIGFNGKYLIDVLGVHAAGDTIELGLTDEVGPGVLRGSQDPDLHVRRDADAALTRRRARLPTARGEARSTKPVDSESAGGVLAGGGGV